MKPLLLSLLALIMVGCSAPSPDEFVIWHGYRGAERAALEEVLALYNEQTDGPPVRALAVPFDAYADKLSAALPRGRGPDLFVFGHDRLGGWVEGSDAIDPIGFYLSEADKERFLPNMLEAMTYRGQVYGLPLNFKSIALIRNTALAPEAPLDTHDLVSMAEDLTNPDRNQFGLAYEFANPDMHAALMNGFGGGVFDDAGTVALNRPENVAAFDLLLHWQNEASILLPEPTGALVLSVFNTGKTPFVISGPWFLSEVAPEIEVGISPLPNIVEAGGAPIQPWIFIEGIFVTRTSRDPQRAFEIAQFITSETGQTVMAEMGRQLPAATAVWEQSSISEDPVAAGFRAQMEQGAPMPNIPELALFWSPADVAMDQVLRSGRAPTDALAEAQTKMTAAIDALREQDR
ncbi:MAG: extracellular solute-binding protein [Pseudomonadota bacterium]